METTELSERELSMLKAIDDFKATNGYAPTVRELAEWENLATMTAHRTLLSLRTKDVITWDQGQRTIRRTDG